MNQDALRPVLGLFRNYRDASAAVANLVEVGFDDEAIGLVTSPEAVEELVADDGKEAVVLETARSGALGGGALGALLGILAAAGTFTFPVIGPALATSAVANLLGLTAAGAGVGAAYGGFAGALIGLGVAEEEADLYVEGVRNGAILLLVRAAPGRTQIAETAMQKANAAHTGVYERVS